MLSSITKLLDHFHTRRLCKGAISCVGKDSNLSKNMLGWHSSAAAAVCSVQQQKNAGGPNDENSRTGLAS
jgi:hypothetical protein